MLIYLDSDYKCHAEHADGLTAVETNVFDGKCKAFVEGYRFVPAGSVWTRTDGETFAGEMTTPWKDYDTLTLAQSAYEERLAELEDMQAALHLLGVSPIEEVTDNG